MIRLTSSAENLFDLILLGSSTQHGAASLAEVEIVSANQSCCSVFGMTLPSTWVFRFQSDFHSSGPSAHFAKLLQLNSSISSAEAEAGQGADRDLNHELLHSHHGAAITAADHRLGLLVASGRSWIVIRTRVGPDTSTRRWMLITNSGVVWRMRC